MKETAYDLSLIVLYHQCSVTAETLRLRNETRHTIQTYFHSKEETMKKSMLVTLTMILALSVFNWSPALAAPVQPPVPTRGLIATLSGPAINGVVPTAKASFQATQGDTSLAVGASNVNLPDFTVLTVTLDGTVVIQMPLIGGKAGRTLSPSPIVHVGQNITISAGGSVILSGTF